MSYSRLVLIEPATHASHNNVVQINISSVAFPVCRQCMYVLYTCKQHVLYTCKQHVLYICKQHVLYTCK